MSVTKTNWGDTNRECTPVSSSIAAHHNIQPDQGLLKRPTPSAHQSVKKSTTTTVSPALLIKSWKVSLLSSISPVSDVKTAVAASALLAADTLIYLCDVFQACTSVAWAKCRMCEGLNDCSTVTLLLLGSARGIRMFSRGVLPASLAERNGCDASIFTRR